METAEIIIAGVVALYSILGIPAHNYIKSINTLAKANELALVELRGDLKLNDSRDGHINDRLTKIDNELAEIQKFMVEIREFMAAQKKR